LSETHQLLVCADDDNVLDENINTPKRKAQKLSEFSRELGSEVNPDRTKYTVMSHYQNAVKV